MTIDDFPTIVVVSVLLLFAFTMLFHDYEADNPYYDKASEEKAKEEIARRKQAKKNSRFKIQQ